MRFVNSLSSVCQLKSTILTICQVIVNAKSCSFYQKVFTLHRKSKKMKHYFFILLFVLTVFGSFPMNAQSSKKPIATNGGCGCGFRSVVSNVPELYQSEDTIFICSSYYYNNVDITVTDSNDAVVQSETVTLTGGEDYPYIIYANAGTYKITLTNGSRYIYGYFAIE